MAQDINAEIITIGTEILLGEIADTNSVYMAQALRDIGVNLYFMTSVGDNEQRIADAIRTAFSRAQLVITCGGLGPTVDDVTRQGVARATDRDLVFHQELLDQISARFSGFRVKMTENNRRQAYLPTDAILIENPVGTAPSFIVEHEGHAVISLPGVPREMKFLFKERVIPYLSQRYGLRIIKSHTLRTAGVGESALDTMIGQDLLEQNNPTVGLAAHQGQVDVRITAKADTETEAKQLIVATEKGLRERIGKYVFGVNSDTLEEILVRLLQEHNATIAVSETGLDAVTSRLKSIEGGEEVLTLVQSYPHPNDLKSALPQPSDLSIRDLASRIAEDIARQSGATVGIAVICHPEMGENADSESGTAVAVYTENDARSRIYGFGGRFELTRPWVFSWSLAVAWRMLTDAFSEAH